MLGTVSIRGLIGNSAMLATSNAGRCALGVLVIHAALLAWSASRHSFTFDEVGHLAAGIDHLKTGSFRLYCVNPPLIRMTASLPVSCLLESSPDRPPATERHGLRSEFTDGIDFLERHGAKSFWFLTIARWTCIPFSLLGACICWNWSQELYGRRAGLASLILWCSCPTILGHGHLITPDVGSTALGVAACYLFWRWMRLPTLFNAFLAGTVLGLALLAKNTCILLFILYPCVWLLYSLSAKQAPKFLHLLGIQLCGLLVLNLGYSFEGTGTKLGSFQFLSTSLGGVNQPAGADLVAGNRFAASVLGDIPVPFPKWYILGIDLQRSILERPGRSYLHGKWKAGGWLHYYVQAALMKLPLGTMCLLLLACVKRRAHIREGLGIYDEAFVLSIAIMYFAFVSSQTGFNRHLRYALPAFPFLFIWASRVFGVSYASRPFLCNVAAPTPVHTPLMARLGSILGTASTAVPRIALMFTIASSAWCYPHTLSYFNEAIGGPLSGPYHLAGSNVDWGQDVLYLKRWYTSNLTARPLFVALSTASLYEPKILGMDVSIAPAMTARERMLGAEDRNGLAGGWYAISTNILFGPTGEYSRFTRFQPADYAGYSIWIFHVPPSSERRAGDN